MYQLTFRVQQFNTSNKFTHLVSTRASPGRLRHVSLSGDYGEACGYHTTICIHIMIVIHALVRLLAIGTLDIELQFLMAVGFRIAGNEYVGVMNWSQNACTADIFTSQEVSTRKGIHLASSEHKPLLFKTPASKSL
jgi:hypothetical protein